ncbi:MAG: hypothetical protein IJ343_11560 [Clostridia bacterium]|nr:hypothetical protein [Clostridia bacterium]
MSHLLEGIGIYHLENRDEDGSFHVNYKNWFKEFAIYEQELPQSGVTEAVSQALRKMLASASGMSNFHAIDFLSTYRSCRFREGFTLPDLEELTELAFSVLVERYDKLVSRLHIYSIDPTFPDHILNNMYYGLIHPAAK